MCDWTQVDTLVVDDALDQAWKDRISQWNTHLILASPEAVSNTEPVTNPVTTNAQDGDSNHK
jgi:hypothetical protein